MRNQTEVERRVKILSFWEKYGEQAAQDAFGTSRRTLYRWQAVLEKAQGKLPALDPRSTAPKTRRLRRVAPEIEAFIVRMREEHSRLGKKKLAVLLRAEGHAVSESYTGRVLADLKKRGLLHGPPLTWNARTGKHYERHHSPVKKKRRALKRGLEVDTIVRFIEGTKRYVLTAVDVERKFTFAAGYVSHSSAAAADFLHKLAEVAPFPVTEVQTDNGSEFAHHFRDACASLRITHYHTYPKSPKMNACIERFNRTLSEDFIQWHRFLLRDDLAAFNDKLIDWLLWYNTERPHESLGLVSPMRYIVSTLSAEECQRYWTRTSI